MHWTGDYFAQLVKVPGQYRGTFAWQIVIKEHARQAISMTAVTMEETLRKIIYDIDGDLDFCSWSNQPLDHFSS